MILRNKKTLSIIFAGLAGVGIIFFAWRFGVSPKSNAVGTSGAARWGNKLSVVPQTGSTTPLRGVSSTRGGDESTTTTAVIARELLANYLSLSQNNPTEMSEEVANVFAQKVLNDNAPASTLKQYTEADLNIVKTSTSTLSSYRTEVSRAMKTFISENTFNELSLVAKAVETRDEKKLLPLSNTVKSYQKLVDTFLSIKTPLDSAPLHLYTTQGYATVLSGIIDMQKILTDPIVGMQGMAKYNSGMKMISQINSVSTTFK